MILAINFPGFLWEKENTFGSEGHWNCPEPFMKYLFSFLQLLIAASAFTQDAGPVDSTERKQVSKTIAAFAATWNKHDVQAFSNIFSEDADFTNVVGMGGHGRTEVENFYAKPFTTWFKNSHFSMVKEKIRFIKPDVAAVDAWWEMSGTVNSEGKPNSLRKGLLNFIMTKQGDQWFITVMHNLDLAED